MNGYDYKYNNDKTVTIKGTEGEFTLPINELHDISLKVKCYEEVNSYIESEFDPDDSRFDDEEYILAVTNEYAKQLKEESGYDIYERKDEFYCLLDAFDVVDKQTNKDSKDKSDIERG